MMRSFSRSRFQPNIPIAHRRQFIIGPKAVSVYANWRRQKLEESIWVSYCPELRIEWSKDAEGNLWGLLGLAVETLENKPNPLMQMAHTARDHISEHYFSWAGRWLLVGRGQIHMDASGLLGCYYGRTRDSRLWVSSSPALLARILSPEMSLETDLRPLYYEKGISWYTPPRSRFVGMGRLLPSQVIDLREDRIVPRPLMPPINPNRNYDETLEQLKYSLVTTLRRLSPIRSRLWLGLTAGFDSRLILAIASNAEIDMMPYTRLSARVKVADRLLPPKLASICGYGHLYIKGRQYNYDRKPLVLEHCAGHLSEGDAEPFLQGVRDTLEGISFGGHGLGVASGFSNLRRLPNEINDPQVVAQQIARVFGEPANSTATTGICEWLRWISDHPQEHLDWRDRFVLEQRLGGWLSVKEQLYDITKLERFPLLNSARNYALLLGLNESQRLGSLVQVELIRRLVPELLNIPFNPSDNYFNIFQRTIIKVRYPRQRYQEVKNRINRLWRKGRRKIVKKLNYESQ